MDDPVEQKLRAALAPRDPGEDFTQRVLARLPAEGSSDGAQSESNAHAAAARGKRWSGWVPAALAASVAFVAVGLFARQEWLARREAAAGLAAKEQLLDALRVTRDKLDLAYRAVDNRRTDNPS
jgi:hypothetical protein